MVVKKKSAAAEPSGAKAAGKAATKAGATKKAAKTAKAAKKPAGKSAKAAARTAARPAAKGAQATTTGKSAGKAAGTGKAAGAAAKKAPAGKRAAARKKTGARKVAAKKTVVGTAASAGGGSAVPAARNTAAPGDLAVLPGEEPWTEEDVEEARSELLGEVERLKAEIASSEAAVQGLLRDSGDGAGDEADTGAKNITRESELALAANTREMLTQADRALRRLEEGTYGLCEVCGKPIGKARMQAFPRATLCLDDKQRQERR
jgi:RNA polymerase-binding protein DksA